MDLPQSFFGKDPHGKNVNLQEGFKVLLSDMNFLGLKRNPVVHTLYLVL